LCGVAILCLLALPRPGAAHDESRERFLRSLAIARAAADASAEKAAPDADACQLTIHLVDDFSGETLPGLVRVTSLLSNKAIKLSEPVHQTMNWYALPAKTTLRVPRSSIRIEAIQGLETARAERTLDLRSAPAATVELKLRRFYDARQRLWHAGNTHLHLMNLSREDAERYLQDVTRANGLDLVFLSHLRRIPGEEHYISNHIVEEGLAGDVFRRLSRDGVLFAGGQEHRHNFGRGGEGFGHVMFLDLPRLIPPISFGPGIMSSGSDGRTLQQSIRQARADGATVIWCHNAFGFEDLPNWAGGLLHAQNIFDGGSQGTYEDTFYRYLNLGMRIPFSTGTDWFIYDFSRVYVPVDGELSAAGWLEGLRGGKSYITNGPFLEMETERAEIGGTLHLNGPNRVTVVGRGMGRMDFGGLELVYNGRVVDRVKAVVEDGCFYADLRHSLDIDEPGWFALRIPSDAGKNEFDRPLFAHTSPIYIELENRRLFRPDVAHQLIDEIRKSMKTIEDKAVFADDAERKKVLAVYTAAISSLEARIRAEGQ